MVGCLWPFSLRSLPGCGPGDDCRSPIPKKEMTGRKQYLPRPPKPTMMIRFRNYLAIALLLIGFLAGPALALQNGSDFNLRRDKLLSYLLRQQLTTNHYQPKAVDDTLSKAAFGLYLKQLDSQKRFLLKQDVARLQQFATKIDDELNQGVLELPAVSAAIQRKRVQQVRDMVHSLLATNFDFNHKEQFETDPEKLDFCASLQELRERWRLTLKYQVMNRYLNLEEDEAAPAKDGATASVTPAERQRTAREKVLKNLDNIFDRLLEEKEQDFDDCLFQRRRPHLRSAYRLPAAHSAGRFRDRHERLPGRDRRHPARG